MANVLRGTIGAGVVGELNRHIKLHRMAEKRKNFVASSLHLRIIISLTRGQTVCYNGFDSNWRNGTALAVVSGGVKCETYEA